MSQLLYIPTRLGTLLNTAAVLSTISSSTSQEVPQSTNSCICCDLKLTISSNPQHKLVTQETSLLNTNLGFGKTVSHDIPDTNLKTVCNKYNLKDVS